MEISEIKIELTKIIKELDLPSHVELSANIGMANFIYLLECLKRDFKMAHNKDSTPQELNTPNKQLENNN